MLGITHRRLSRTTIVALALLILAGAGPGALLAPAGASGPPGELLVYYGWPSLINGVESVAGAAAEFALYDYVILGSDLELNGHQDHDATVAIIADPALSATLVFGYVNLGMIDEPLTLTEVENRIDLWQAMGVDGICFDAFGYDWGVTREWQNAAVGYVHSLGLPVVTNAWFPDDVFGDDVVPTYNPNGVPTEMGAADYYMSESYFVQQGAYQDYEYWLNKAEVLDAYRADLGFGILSTTTNGPDDAYSQELHHAAWYAATDYGHVATGWGEYLFSADDNLAPFRPRPPGMLRATTSPAVPSQILVDGIPRDTWGLTWVKLPTGQYEVSFTDVPGFTTPAPQWVTVSNGVTTEWPGLFGARGYLRVITSPPVPSTIYVDGVPRNDWGMWTDLPPGTHEVCFGWVTGYATPACQTVNVTAGQTSTVTGTFVAAGVFTAVASVFEQVLPRIVGGTEVSPEGKYPFIVTVYPGPYICGGALVSDSWVLTAAHCTEGIAAADIEVVVGRHDRRDTDEGEEIGVTAKYEHPDYGTPTQWSNDFSLLALASPSTLGSPIGLAGPDEVDLYPTGTMATVVGWGDTSWQGDLSWVLLEVDVPIVSDADCAAVYESDFDGPTMVCAGYEEGGKDPCQGDSGGPLFLDAGGAYLHIGVVSFGYQCAVPGYPGVFAESSSAYEWIAATAGLGDGMLRVTTSPPVVSQIVVDGIPRDTWGLTWVKLPAGEYTVSFTDVPGFTTPASEMVTVVSGVTTEWTGVFGPRGYLRVITSPPVPSTVYVDGVPRNDWGMWTDLPPGSYEVCFGAVTGYTTPGCQTANVTAGQTTTVTGDFD